MRCTTDTVKFTLNVLNVVIAILGLALIAIVTLFLHRAPTVYIYYLYIIGFTNLIAGILGCCGICSEHVCLTATYAAIIFLSLVAQVFGMIFASNSETIRQFGADAVEKAWMEEIRNPGAMDSTQQTFECCGRTSPQDYLRIGRLNFPASCYPDNIINPTVLYEIGCTQAAENSFVSDFTYSTATEWSSLVITVVMFIFAVYLAWHFNDQQRKYEYN